MRDAPRELVGDVIVRHPRAQAGELVAAEARDRVVRPDRAPAAVGERGEAAVGRGMAEAVGDDLAVVEIGEGDGEGQRLVARARAVAAWLVSVSPRRETLEDLFLRQVVNAEAAPGPDSERAS